MSSAALGTREPVRLPLVAGWAVALVAVGAIGALGTDTSSDWYLGLDLPPFQPPGAVFGIVWTVLYVMIGAAGVLGTRAATGAAQRRLLTLFAVNLVLNVGWTWIFFTGQAPVLAGVEVLALLATTLALVRVLLPLDKRAAGLLVPYALWVAFASVLTWTIALTN